MRAELKTLRTSANIEILGAAPARPSPLAKSGT
jgi:hypothetical protein